MNKEKTKENITPSRAISERSLMKGISHASHSKWLTFIFVSTFLFLITKQVDAATLFINPGSGSFNVGQTFTVSVRTNTQSAAVNIAEANVTFSTDTLELLSVSQGSSFYLPSPGSPSRTASSAYFGGGVPTPGYNGSSGIVGNMTFRARSEGTATISISSGKVLLNDGSGTDALSGVSGARFTISPPPVGNPVVTSTTHNGTDGWSNKTTLDLSWSRPSGAFGFSFEFDQNEDTVPDNTLDTTITTSQSYPDLKDGVYYFHIKARGQAPNSAYGNTVHFRVGVDTQKPLLFDIDLVGQSDLNDVTRTPTITFEGKDELSGIASYDIYIDDELVQTAASSPYAFEKLESGPHVIRVLSFDKAGNDRKAELPIIVSGPPSIGFFQRNLEIPVYLLLIINLLILILIVVVIYVLLRKKRVKGGTDDVARIQAEIDQSLDELKQTINVKLINLASKQAAGEVSQKVNKTKKTIDQKIEVLKKTIKKQKNTT